MGLKNVPNCYINKPCSEGYVKDNWDKTLINLTIGNLEESNLNIELKVKHLFINSKLVTATSSLTQCYLAMFTHSSASNTWLIGLNQLADYYTVLRQQENKDGQRALAMMLTHKNEYDALLQGTWQIQWITKWPEYTISILIAISSFILTMLALLNLVRRCIGYY